MKIIAVDPFYLKMPQITDAADGTQDTLVVRIQTDEGITGWGECDASPLVSLAAYCCPMSHGNIINIRESLIGETLDNPNDVVRLHEKALRNGLDIQQIHHAYSGADIALWDIVGQNWVSRSIACLIRSPKLFQATVCLRPLWRDPRRNLSDCGAVARAGISCCKVRVGTDGEIR